VKASEKKESVKTTRKGHRWEIIQLRKSVRSTTTTRYCTCSTHIYCNTNNDHYGLTRVQYCNPVSRQSRTLVVSDSSLTEIIYFFSLITILFILLHSQRHLFHWLYRLLVDLSTVQASGRKGENYLPSLRSIYHNSLIGMNRANWILCAALIYKCMVYRNAAQDFHLVGLC